MRQATVTFKNSKGNKLVGILSNPSDTADVPIVVLCHGFTTSKDNRTNTILEKKFNEKNIATFRFDFYGHGESEGSFENITVSEGVDDTFQAIEVVKEKGFSNIGLIGSSFGGATSIMTASKSKDLSVLALKSPVSNFLERDLELRTPEEINRWKSEGYVYYINGRGEKKKVNYSFFEDFSNNDGYKAAENISIPVLIVHGDADESVPIKQSNKISKILSNCTLEVIQGADHGYSNPEDFEKMINLIVEFVSKNL